MVSTKLHCYFFGGGFYTEAVEFRRFVNFDFYSELALRRLRAIEKVERYSSLRLAIKKLGTIFDKNAILFGWGASKG